MSTKFGKRPFPASPTQQEFAVSVSSIDSSLLNSLLTQANASTSSSSTSLTVSTTTVTSDTSSPSTIVTLGNQSASSLASTYNAQGLMSAIVQSDPLFGDSSDSSSDSLASVVNAIVQSVQTQTTGSDSTTGTSDSSDTSSDTSTTGTSSSNESGGWAQILQNDPGMAPVFVQNEMEQGLAAILGAST
jgi:iron transport multicopper oxidase